MKYRMIQGLHYEERKKHLFIMDSVKLRIFEFNSTARLIVLILCDFKTQEELIKEFSHYVRKAENEITTDVIELLNSLIELDLIEKEE